MSELRIEVDVGQSGEARARAFLSDLLSLLAAGAFSPPESDVPTAAPVGRPTLAATGRGYRMTVPLAPGTLVWCEALASLFYVDESADAFPPSLLAVDGPEEPQALLEPEEWLAQWRAAGRVTWTDRWEETKPWTLEIDFAEAVDSTGRDVLDQRLHAFERVVADAPFLACRAGEFAAMGETQALWISSRTLHLSTAGIASEGPWLALLCRMLFSRVGAPAASEVRILG